MQKRLLLVLAFCLLTGCGTSSPYKYTKVNGKITYEDGSPLPGGVRLLFEAQDAPVLANATPGPASAIVGGDGAFDCATSYKYGDGLIPGKHKLAIEVGKGPDGKAAVKKEYASLATTPLIVDTANLPMEIKVPKP